MNRYDHVEIRIERQRRNGRRRRVNVVGQATSGARRVDAVDKSARVTGPCLPTSQGIATATVDRAIVTAENKRANSEDVLKGQAVIIADLQYPAIEPILQVKVVAEGYLHRAGIADRIHVWRKKLLVADRGRIIYERSIGRRIGWWRGYSGIRCHPCRA